MIFIDNKYTRIYFRIVSKSTPKIGYTEIHHIIPKSLGGSNDPSNLVKLTAKEHYICHLLLRKMTTGTDQQKMICAAWAMSTLKVENQPRVTSRSYETLRKEYAQLMSKRRKGKATVPKGTKFTEEHRKNIAAARIGKSWGYKHPPITKEKMSAWQKGIPKEKHKCIHCGKEASFTNIARWHNDKCKFQ